VRNKWISLAAILSMLAMLCVAGIGTLGAQSAPAGPAVQGAWGLEVSPPQAWHDPICAGDRERYTLIFKNNTTMTLNDVVVTDTLPEICPQGCDVCQWNDNDWPYDDCSPGATYDGQRTVSWKLVTVDPGETVTLYLEVRFRSNVPHQTVVQNCLTVNSNQIGPASACSQAKVVQCPEPTATPVPSVTPTVTPKPSPTPTTYIPEVYKLYLPDIYNYFVVFPTPTPTPTPAAPIEQCYRSEPGNGIIYRVDPSLFRGYAGDDASHSALNLITSPPAPAGWNEPGFVPDSSWRAPVQVWWPAWNTGDWPLRFPATIIGMNNSKGKPEGLDGTTHLIRYTLELTPPEPGMHVTKALLNMWSDNKTAWWWNGELLQSDAQLQVGNHPLYPDHVGADGGTYLLAVQNSNDYMRIQNPQGTAFQVCVTWAR